MEPDVRLSAPPIHAVNLHGRNVIALPTGQIVHTSIFSEDTGDLLVLPAIFFVDAAIRLVDEALLRRHETLLHVHATFFIVRGPI